MSVIHDDSKNGCIKFGADALKTEHSRHGPCHFLSCYHSAFCADAFCGKRRARSRILWKNLFVILLMMLHITQNLEPR